MNVKLSNIALVDNYRKLKADQVDDLANSIKEVGLLQPLTVRKKKGTKSKYELITGYRRYAALKQIKAKEAPVHEIEVDDDQIKIMQISENINRVDVHPIDEAEAVVTLIEAGYSVDDIAKKLHRTKAYVTRRKMIGQGLSEKAKEKYRAIDTPSISNMTSMSMIDSEKQDEMPDYWYTRTDSVIDEKSLNYVGWDLDDDSLFPEMGACSTCQYNSANDNSLFPDEIPGCCFYPCYEEKQVRTARRWIEAIENGENRLFLQSYSTPERVNALLEEHGIKTVDYQHINRLHEPEKPEKPLKKDFYEIDEAGKKVFDEDEYEWQMDCYKEDLEEFEDTLEENKLLRESNDVYLAIRTDMSQVFECVLETENIEQASEKTSGNEDSIEIEINKIETREERAKELDFEKIHSALYEEVTNSQFFNAGHITGQTKRAAAMGLYFQLPWDMTHLVKKLLMTDKEAEESNDDQFYSFDVYGAIAEANDETLDNCIEMCLRILIYSMVSKKESFSNGGNTRAVAFKQAYYEYDPDLVVAVVDEYMEKREKREKRVASRIQKLKDKEEAKKKEEEQLEKARERMNEEPVVDTSEADPEPVEEGIDEPQK